VESSSLSPGNHSLRRLCNLSRTSVAECAGNGKPCANAARGIRRNKARTTAVGRTLRLKKGLDLTDGMDSEPTYYLRLPAGPQIGCSWRKRNLTQSACPTTSRRSVIPGRNNRRTWFRDQVDRAAGSDTLCKAIGWQMRLGYRYAEGI
jgi:hypothetical protein